MFREVARTNGGIEDDWDLRNLLYSLRFNTTAATLIPGSNYREQYVKFSFVSFFIADMLDLKCIRRFRGALLANLPR